MATLVEITELEEDELNRRGALIDAALDGLTPFSEVCFLMDTFAFVVEEASNSVERRKLLAAATRILKALSDRQPSN